MKSPVAQIFQRDKEEFLQWWGNRSIFEKFLFGLWGTMELLFFLIIVLEGLDYSGII